MSFKIDLENIFIINLNNKITTIIAKLATLENYDDTNLNIALDNLTNAINKTQADVETLATKEYVNDNLGGKKLIYLTEAEYNALPEEEKNLDNIVYNIIMK